MEPPSTTAELRVVRNRTQTQQSDANVAQGCFGEQTKRRGKGFVAEGTWPACLVLARRSRTKRHGASPPDDLDCLDVLLITITL